VNAEFWGISTIDLAGKEVANASRGKTPARIK
jgi:hypothetical protein